jgi:hypothetical protein
MLKARTDTKKTDTAIARAAQAAIQFQMTQNTGHFPIPRGVNLKWVSTTMTWDLSLVRILLLTNIVANDGHDVVCFTEVTADMDAWKDMLLVDKVVLQMIIEQL